MSALITLLWQQLWVCCPDMSLAQGLVPSVNVAVPVAQIDQYIQYAFIREENRQRERSEMLNFNSSSAHASCSLLPLNEKTLSCRRIVVK